MSGGNLVGLRLIGEAEYVVSPRVVTAFADAVGEADPLCHSRRAAQDAGLAGVVAPPGFAFVPTYPLSIAIVRAAGINPDHITHVAESQRLNRPITAGQVLSSAASIIGHREAAEGARLLSWRADLADTGGEPVGTTASTVLVRRDNRWPHRRDPAPYRPRAAATRHRFQVTRAHLAKYCEVSGDTHPVHRSDVAARQCGLGGVIMHGSLLLAVAGRAATASAGGPAGVTELGGRFTMPVEVPDDDLGCQLDVTAASGPAGKLALDVGVHGHRVLAAASAAITAHGRP